MSIQVRKNKEFLSEMFYKSLQKKRVALINYFAYKIVDKSFSLFIYAFAENFSHNGCFLVLSNINSYSLLLNLNVYFIIDTSKVGPFFSALISFDLCNCCRIMIIYTINDNNIIHYS